MTVSRASLHNREEMRRKDIRVDDRVRIQRAGDVIPEVIDRIEEPGKKRRTPFRMPARCPSCHTTVQEGGPYTGCPNTLGCPAQLKGKLRHMASKPGLDIEQLGTETVSELVDKGLVKEVADVFRLREDDLLQLENFAERSAKKLIETIQSRKSIPLHRFVYALGIPEVGKVVARELADRFQSLDRLCHAEKHALEAIPGVGPKMAAAIGEFFHEPQNQRVINTLLEAGIHVSSAKRTQTGPFANKTFVLTGNLNAFSRSEAQQIIESLGGRPTSSVSKETDYVIVGQNPGKKIKEAKARNRSLLQEKEFITLLRQAGASV